MGTLRTVTCDDGSLDGGGSSFDSVDVNNGGFSVDTSSTAIEADGSAGYFDLVTTKNYLGSLRHGKFALLMGYNDSNEINWRRLMDWAGTAHGAEDASAPKFESRATEHGTFQWTAASGKFETTLTPIEKEVLHVYTVVIDGAGTNGYTTVDAGNIGGQSGHELGDTSWTAPLDRPNEQFVRCGCYNTAANFTNVSFAFHFIIDLSASDPTVTQAYSQALSTVANDAARANNWDADDVWAALHASDTDLTCVCWKCDETISGTTKITRYVSSGASLVAATFRDEVYGSELVVNGAFAADTNWAKSDGALTIGSGVATWSGGQSGNADLTPSVAILTVNSRYQVTYDVTRSAGSVQILAGTTAATAVSAAGSYHVILECIGNTTLTIRGDSSFAGTIDNVTCRQITTEAEGVTNLAPELVANNADFGTWSGDDPSNWTVAGEDSTDPEVSEVGSGEAHGGSGSDHLNLYTSDTDVVSVAQNITTVVSDTYLVEVDVNKITTGTVRIQAIGVATVTKDFTFAGKARMIFTSDQVTTAIKITTAGAAADFTIDAISVKQVGSLTRSSGLSNSSTADPVLFGEQTGFTVEFDSGDSGDAWGKIDLDGTNWVPSKRRTLSVAFSIDPNSLTMASENVFQLLKGEGAQVICNLGYDNNGTSSYELRGGIENDSGAVQYTAWKDITDAPHKVEIRATYATSATANNASIELWIDGAKVSENDGEDVYDAAAPTFLEYGHTGGVDSGTTGRFFLGNVTVKELGRHSNDLYSASMNDRYGSGGNDIYADENNVLYADSGNNEAYEGA